MSFQLSVITPSGEAFNAPVESVLAPGMLGQFVVLTGHAPIVAALKAGQLDIVADAKRQSFQIAEGVLEVDGSHQCLVLVEDFKQHP